MKSKGIILLFTSIVLMTLINGCSATAETIDATTEIEKNYVKTYPLKQKEFVKEIVLPGETSPYQKVQLTSKTSGEIMRIHKTIGDPLTAGEQVLQLDNTTQQLTYNNAKNNYKTALIASKKMKDIEENPTLTYQPIARAKTNYAIAEANYLKAKKDYEDIQALYAQKAVSLTTVEQTKNAYFNAKESFELSQSTYESAKNNFQYDLEQIELNVASAENALANAKESLEHTIISSPIDGIVSAKHVELGENISPGFLLYEIINLDYVYITTGVSETEISHVVKDQEVEVYIEALDTTVKGTVTNIGPTPTTTNKYPVKILLENPNHQIKSSMYAETRIITDVVTHLAIKKEALLSKGDSTYCFVKVGDVAKKILVDVVVEDENFYGVTGPLNANDQIIYVGQHALQENSQIKTK